MEHDTIKPIAMQAPVLTVERLFPDEQGVRLIEYWESHEKSAGVVIAPDGSDAAVKESSKRRQDVFLPDGDPLLDEVSQRVAAAIGAAVLAAFQYRIEVMEGVRVGCYDAADRGFFRAHHDNTTPATAHRRFAMSVNLNTGEYEGGGLRFPEFGGATYAPPRGGAAVFSCSLLHEVQPVTSGRRFGLFTFFCSEADERARLERAQGQPGS
jgi:predicted 2-oxoglutarate/Fe(II)-dependent dioxygenase YbiX